MNGDIHEDQLTFWSEEHLVSHFPLPVLEAGLEMREETSPLPICEWLTNYVLSGQSGKTSLASCHRTEEGILEPSSGRWLNSGTASHGECWTLKTSESPNDAEECSLLDVLVETSEILPRYYLSPTAAAGILRRAERRNKTVPPRLYQALLEVSTRSVEEAS